MGDYDVFLNHRGPDVKGGFIAHLNEALRVAGLNPFLDKISLTKGDPAFTSIDEALEQAKVHVAVVSKGYAESKYCLSELVAMVRSGKPVIPVFYGVEPAHLRRVQNGVFAAAFKKHKSRERADEVAEWADALRRLADIAGFCLSDYKGDEAELKREVVNAVKRLKSRSEALPVERGVVDCEEPVNTNLLELEMRHAAKLPDSEPPEVDAPKPPDYYSGGPSQNYAPRYNYPPIPVTFETYYSIGSILYPYTLPDP